MTSVNTEIKQLPEEYQALKATIDTLLDSATATNKYSPQDSQFQAVALFVQAKLGGDIKYVDVAEGDNWRSKSLYCYNVIEGQDYHFCPEALPSNPSFSDRRNLPSPAIGEANTLISRYNAAASGKVEPIQRPEVTRAQFSDVLPSSNRPAWIPVTQP